MLNGAPYIILVNPQLAENVGMTARAMMNCGLYNLRLVNPRENHLCDKAISASSNASSILENAQVFSSLKEAVADLHHIFATTARRREMIKPIYLPETAMKEISQNIENARYGVIFGAERTGLENDDVAICDGIIEIPLNPEHTSLNLSQAVLLIGYEWQKLKNTRDGKILITNKTEISTKEEVLTFLDFVENELDKVGKFDNDEKRPRMVRNLQNMFVRADITQQEIKTLYGVIKFLTNKKEAE